jgi:hypothetical protein
VVLDILKGKGDKERHASCAFYNQEIGIPRGPQSRLEFCQMRPGTAVHSLAKHNKSRHKLLEMDGYLTRNRGTISSKSRHSHGARRNRLVRAA